MTKAEAYWERYLAATNQDKDEATFSGELIFENKGFTGEEQLSLILSGRKTVSFSAFPSYAINREPISVAGEVYIVEDRDENPRCIIELTAVQVLPFNEVSWEMAEREGEDENLTAWRDKQREYFEDEAAVCGFDFTEDMRIVCEFFTVIYR